MSWLFNYKIVSWISMKIHTWTVSCCCSCRWGERVSEQWSPTGMLFTPRRYRWVWSPGGMILTEFNFVHQKSHTDWPGLRGERPATNRLNRGTACKKWTVPLLSFATPALKMETACIYEKLASTYETTQRQSPKRRQHHTNLLERLKSHTLIGRVNTGCINCAKIRCTCNSFMFYNLPVAPWIMFWSNFNLPATKEKNRIMDLICVQLSYKITCLLRT
jgi:hypothetical protein